MIARVLRFASGLMPLAAMCLVAPAVAGPIANLSAGAVFAVGGKSVLYRVQTADGWVIRRMLADGRVHDALTQRAFLAQAHLSGVQSALPDHLVADGSGIGLRFGRRRWHVSDAGGLSDEGAAPPPVDAPDGEDGPAQSASPDGRYVISADGPDLRLLDRQSGRSLALTRDGTWDQPWGRDIAPLTRVLAARSEHPDLPVRAVWNAASNRVLTFRIDMRGVQPLSITRQNEPGTHLMASYRYIYPLAGMARVPKLSRFVIDIPASLAAGHGVLVPVEIPPEDMLYPAPPDDLWLGEHPRIVWTKRGYGMMRVYDVEPRTGHARVVVEEHGDPLVFPTATAFLPAPRFHGEFVISERTGWSMLYLVTPDAPTAGRALTHGAWNVLRIVARDPAHHAVLLVGVGREAGQNPYQRMLYRLDTQSLALQVLTPEKLDHAIVVSPDGRLFVDAMSDLATSTRTVLRDARDGHVVGELSHADAGGLRAARQLLPQGFEGVASDGKTPLYGTIFRPPGFDPKRRYPVIEAVYTGPTSTWNPVSFAQGLGHVGNRLAEFGAIVIVSDTRGNSLRGRAFRLPSYRHMGTYGIDEHIAMIRRAAELEPAMDLSRVGVWGHSAGGFDAARFILRRGDFYRVAVAESGCHDLRLDKAWWPEASMGLADDATWDAASNMSVAGNLAGKLLLLHGDIDDNVPVTETYRLQAAIVQAGKSVDMTIIPNARHHFFGPYAWGLVRSYFETNLFGVAQDRAGQSR